MVSLDRPTLRARVVWTIARRDLARVRGRAPSSRRLATLLPVALLAAAALVPAPGPTTAPGPPVVRVGTGTGQVALAEHLHDAGLVVHRADADGAQPPPVASLGLDGDGTPRLTARRVDPALRRALDALPGPVVRRERHQAPPSLPPHPRALLLLLIAVSLLTGPLTESLPGERAQHTWDTLRAAAVSELEIVVGKWLAWTGAGCAGVGMALLAALLAGTLPLSVALLGLPLAIALTVAAGLWLVAPSADPTGSATVPVRVIPLMVAGLGALAWVLAPGPTAAWVPLGAPLLLMVGGSAPHLLLGSIASTVLALWVLLPGAARRSRSMPRDTAPWPLVPLALASASQLVLGAWGPARLGGSATLAAAGAASVMLATAAVLHLRQTQPERPSPSARGGLAGLVVGVGLAGTLLIVPAGPRLLPWAPPPDPVLLAGTAGALAQEFVFRVMPARRGPASQVAAGAIWWLGCGLAAPTHSAATALVLGVTAARWGGTAPTVARLVLCLLLASRGESWLLAGPH